MIADGYAVGDGSWELKVKITDMDKDITMRVKGDLHIGGLMLKLVEVLEVALDYSDHALWWPKKKKWLTATRSTLDQSGVQADSELHFTPMHKHLRIQLPDLRYIECKVDFSVKTFSAVVKLCKELEITHPEELSFCWPVKSVQMKKTKPSAKVSLFKKEEKSESLGNLSERQGTPERLSPSVSLLSTPASSPMWSNSPRGPLGSPSFNGSVSFQSDISSSSQDFVLYQSPSTPSEEAKSSLFRPKTLVDKVRLNAGWLDSSLSLYEQGVMEGDTLYLKYKYYCFYDLNPKYDAVRINQIYQQARWSILTEEIDCTEEEMMMFAALQFQVSLQAKLPQPEYEKEEDDIDAALTDLQISLEGSAVNTKGKDITHVPELTDELQIIIKPKRLTLKRPKKYKFSFKDTKISIYKSDKGAPVMEINLKGCEVTPDVNISQGRYGIRLEAPTQEGMVDYWIRCNDREQYAKWMAACRLATKGKTMADSSYDMEVRSILDFLQLQQPADAPIVNPSQVDINLEDFVAPRFLKRSKEKQIITQILQAHVNVSKLNLVEAKMNFIKAWQALPEYGISLFTIKFTGCKREELLGIAYNRLMRMEFHSGDLIKTWRFNTMKAWNVNWNTREMMVQFEEEEIVFSCLSAHCKVVHEFIGGYIFLSMRSKDQNQMLNEDLFHKLTGGWL
ncbi:unc-112-related protein-like [Tachypleus tridentatus]|uniref:unc-112-related protein-like n=1 Tax=Tachypleus tridentatus TaxID=6853 RepID=UPI003FCF4BAD